MTSYEVMILIFGSVLLVMGLPQIISSRRIVRWAIDCEAKRNPSGVIDESKSYNLLVFRVIFFGAIEVITGILMFVGACSKWF